MPLERSSARVLGSSEAPLDRAYDLTMLDLDGVVYVGRDAVPGAPEHLGAARDHGARLAFVTNNASRSPGHVAAHLSDLGVPARPQDVVTSAQAAARLLSERLGEGAPVAMLGAAGLHEALADRRLDPVAADADADAAVTGYGPDVRWSDLMRVAVRIRDGLWWVATNTDRTIPTDYGVAPGHGVQVRMLQDFTGVEPVVAGKPARPLLDETVRRVGGDRPLMVGDRLDTDIEGARNAGVDSLLVMTGVTGLRDLVAAPERQRPTYLAADLGGLAEAQPAVEVSDGTAELGGWTARTEGGALDVSGSGSASDWWRVVAAAAWWHRDEQGQDVATDGLEPPG